MASIFPSCYTRVFNLAFSKPTVPVCLPQPINSMWLRVRVAFVLRFFFREVATRVKSSTRSALQLPRGTLFLDGPSQSY